MSHGAESMSFGNNINVYINSLHRDSTRNNSVAFQLQNEHNREDQTMKEIQKANSLFDDVRHIVEKGRATAYAAVE